MRVSQISRKLALALSAALTLCAAAAQAQSALGAQASVGSTAAATAGGPATVRVDLTGGGASQSLGLPQGKSAVVDLPVDARDVLVSNPGVADVVLRSPRRISVIGMKEGATDAVFFDAAGRRILSLNIHVDVDTVAVTDMINRVVPGAHVRAEGIAGSIVLSGQVGSLADADKAVQIARATVARPELVLNLLTVSGRD
ncbi:MAG TPA: pilus assembly protein N-terminal domain-containing protein, partial [Caulobacteraceae bacterium]|nr:pilus assembly protein N-terminal domain-containing protein [Caulobacteraceae bacterium]